MNRRLKVLILIACFILIWIFIIQIFTGYLKSGIDNNWEAISLEKTAEQKAVITDLYNSYQNDVDNLSNEIAASPEILKQIQRSDPKKLFEELLKLNTGNNYQIEIYNTRLELLAFKGRKLDSDIFSLKKCLNGNKFSVLKEIGFYTFLIQYSPVYSPKDASQIIGIILASKLIDIKYQISNKFFQNSGLLYDINSKLNFVPQIIPANIISGIINLDSASLIEKQEVELNGIDKSKIGILLFPSYNKITHDQKINSLSVKIISVLIFGITIILFPILLIILKNTNSQILKFALFFIFLAIVRIVWLEFHFPSKILDIEIFSPAHYASSFGFGMAKSIGELLITSLFVLFISIYGIILIGKKGNKVSLSNNFSQILFSVLTKLFLFSIFFYLIYLFGSIIQSIVYDSNIKFIDKTNIVPGIELFTIQFIVLILAFALFIFLSSIIIILLKNSISKIIKTKSFKKYFEPLLILLLLLISLFVLNNFINFGIDNLNKILIICFSFGFGLFLAIRIFLSKNYKIFSAKNISIVILFCTISVPGILLDNITSQETDFVEIIGNKIAEKDNDKIKFLIMTELSNLSENKRVESDLRNKNKLTELAFSVWAESKFSEENFNSAVIILDTNNKILSDFIFNSQVLIPDSIVSFANINLKSLKKKITVADTNIVLDSLDSEDILEEDEVDSGTESVEENKNVFITDNVIIMDNKDEKYYLGIVPLEKLELRNTSFATKLGYLIVAVQYESKNILVQTSVQLFKNYSKDNFTEKLISNPVITEYLSGEIVSSTNRDLSKDNTLSLDAFRESVKNKTNKSNWRYETINNEKYRTYYILASQDEFSGKERIYSISLKRNDFKLTTFFYLKFILFAVFVYLLIMIIVSSYMILQIKSISIRLNFREKLFASFFIVSVIPIVLLAFYTRSFIKNKYDYNFQNQIVSDLNLVSQSIKGNQFNLNNLDTLKDTKNNNLIRDLANTEKNFNLFYNTKLISTTNDELYKSDLLDTRVDADAYYNIVYLRKDFFSKTEEIGVYSFIVGYKPFFDSKNNVIGLMSSQTVYMQNEIKEELAEILTFIFGIYLIVIIVLLFLVIYLTDRISQPILRLQYATEKIAKGESNIVLKNNRKDEIGNLVESFNKMTRELEVSKDKLKKAEREAAWRDIARRVAHEIKNPLTPMKLSIEHLYEIYKDDNRNGFEDVLKKTRTIIINEIDKLNKIATEFSNFAKLSGRNYEETDLNEIIGEVISLYKLSPDIEFIEDLDKNTKKIFADKQELNRVFQNLIKNSIQSITGYGKIEIKTSNKNEFVCAEIIDNGCGIESSKINNLFEPNFSTKSSGMGLGLAITKKTLDDMKAEITFESKIDSGTTVVLKFIPFKSGISKD
ncbi:MAG TPA: ATP-binding protein [Ignavibacteria bacterium]|nr:ATP-binding protein [Ignavibacteria bacterium]